MEHWAGDIFQLVLFKRIWLITGAKNICAQIYDQLTYWNPGSFEKLLYNSYSVVMRYLGRACGTHNVEQRHCTFLDFFLRCKLRDLVIFFAVRKHRGSCKLTNWHWTKHELWMKPPHRSWQGNACMKQFPPVPFWRCTIKLLFLLPWTLW